MLAYDGATILVDRGREREPTLNRMRRPSLKLDGASYLPGYNDEVAPRPTGCVDEKRQAPVLLVHTDGVSTVIVVGAGGSLAHALSYRPKRPREHPPLDGDFFSKATTLARTSAIRTGIASMRDAIARTSEGYDPWDRGAITLEQFFADVYYAVASGARTSRSLVTFVETLRLYQRILAQTTNWMAALKRVGDLDRVIRQEIDRSEDRITIVTFNHDLVLESVAEKIPRTGGNWCLKSLYSDVDLQNLNASVGRTYQHHRTGCRHDPPFELLKLHGSLNWFVRSPKRTPDYGTLFPPQRTKRTIYCLNTAAIRLDPRIGSTARPGGRSWHLWPLVVPPIYDKQRVTGMRLLQQVWDRANERIRDCDRLVLFGYSVPDADVLARQMLRTAVRQNSELQVVDCINPDASLTMKLRQVLDVPVVKLYVDVPSFLAHS